MTIILPIIPLSSFRKTKRTGTGTSLVSLFMRNLQSVIKRRLLTGFARLQATLRIADFTTLLVPFRVFTQASEMTVNKVSSPRKAINHSE